MPVQLCVNRACFRWIIFVAFLYIRAISQALVQFLMPLNLRRKCQFLSIYLTFLIAAGSSDHFVYLRYKSLYLNPLSHRTTVVSHPLKIIQFSLVYPIKPIKTVILIPIFECKYVTVLNIIQQYSMTDVSQLDIKDIKDADHALTIVEIFQSIAMESGSFSKDAAKKFLSLCLNNLESQKVSGKNKFHTILLLKQLSYRDKFTTSFFGVVAGHPVFQKMQQIALKTDPNKPLKQKGKNLFPKPQQGNDYIRIILQSLSLWATKYPTNSKKQPTRFKLALNRLIDQKVVLPKQEEFLFYNIPNKSAKTQISTPTAAAAAKPIKPIVQSSPAGQTPGGPGPSAKQTKAKYASELRYIYDKIISYIDILQEEQITLQILQKEIQNYHIKFQKDQQKIKKNQVQMIEDQPDEILGLFFKIFQFIEEESSLYNVNIVNQDYKTYIQGVIIAFDRIFEQSQQKKSKTKIQQPKPSVKNSNAPEIKKTDSILKNDNNTQDKKVQNPPKKQQSKPPKPEAKQKARTSDQNSIQVGRMPPKPQSQIVGAGDSKNALQALFSKISNQSPAHFGFGAITNSLSKEKHAGAFRPKKSHNMTFDKSRVGDASIVRSHLGKSKVVKGIFAAVPNPFLQPKNYEGQLVMQSYIFQQMVNSTKQEQGLRRLKVSLFKNKYLLYQDDFLQIGFKAEPIYQRVDKFLYAISFQMYFGNKTDRSIQNFNVGFTGDKQSYIYTESQQTQSQIRPNSQYKYQILNVSKQIPFGLVNAKLSFNYDGKYRSFTVLMPTSILHMTSYEAVDSLDWQNKWSSCSKYLRSDPLKLSHHFPPDQIKRVIPELNQRSSYNIFSVPGSTTDYILSCKMTLHQRYEGLLNIVIRPNVSVIIQIGMYVNDQMTNNQFKFYLQSLQAVLRQAQI